MVVRKGVALAVGAGFRKGKRWKVKPVPHVWALKKEGLLCEMGPLTDRSACMMALLEVGPADRPEKWFAVELKQSTKRRMQWSTRRKSCESVYYFSILANQCAW